MVGYEGEVGNNHPSIYTVQQKCMSKGHKNYNNIATFRQEKKIKQYNHYQKNTKQSISGAASKKILPTRLQFASEECFGVNAANSTSLWRLIQCSWSLQKSGR